LSVRLAEQARLQARLVELLGRGYGVKRAATVLGRSERTLWAWLAADPTIRERAAKTQEDVDPQAVDVLRELLSHTDPKIRLQAATALLRAPAESAAPDDDRVVTLVVHRTADGEETVTVLDGDVGPEQEDGLPEEPADLPPLPSSDFVL